MCVCVSLSVCLCLSLGLSFVQHLLFLCFDELRELALDMDDLLQEFALLLPIRLRSFAIEVHNGTRRLQTILLHPPK